MTSKYIPFTYKIWYYFVKLMELADLVLWMQGEDELDMVAEEKLILMSKAQQAMQ